MTTSPARINEVDGAGTEYNPAVFSTAPDAARGDGSWRLPIDTAAAYGALLLAGCLVAILIRSALFVGVGSDSSGYVSAGELWRLGALYRPEPFHFWPMWPNAVDLATPLGYRGGPMAGTEVPAYPAGLPILMAAASTVAGWIGPHLVTPIMAGVLVGATFAVARRLGGPIAGLIAAALLGASPEVLLNGVQAMSDVPAAACWIAAWMLALRGTASASVAAGSLCAMASLIRPNLMPLAAVIATIVVVGDDRRWRWRALGAFVICFSIGPVLLAWTQSALYGDPRSVGYGGWETLFDVAYVGTNLEMYPRLFVSSHGVVLFSGLAMLPVAMQYQAGADPQRVRRVTFSAVALIAVNVLLYLPYTPFDHWPFLRFLLPGTAALLVLFGGLIGLAVRRFPWLKYLTPLVVVIAVIPGVSFARYALNDWRAQGNVLLMSRYLNEVLPANAAVLTYIHSGAVAHYTGREVVRADLLAGDLDRHIADLTRRGYHPVLVLDQHTEESVYRQLFANSRFGRLDWPPRAVFTTVTSIWYYDFTDRERHDAGETWPVDVLTP